MRKNRDYIIEDARNKAFSKHRLPKSIRERFNIKIENGFIKLKKKVNK